MSTYVECDGMDLHHTYSFLYVRKVSAFPPTRCHASLVLRRLMSVLQPLDDNYV